ncbi:MAG: GH92 family glycosyl hydrolase, partial [Bacteroidota bacterium]
MKLLLTLFSLLSVLVHAQNNAQFVNVFIGTDGTGHTFPGPSMPFGMVQPGPDNCEKGWSYTSGYQYKDTVIMGFSQTRFSGTGISEMGDILLLPFTNNQNESLKTGYFKNSEKAKPGYYCVTLKNQVKVELTCSERVAFHKYTFPTDEGKVLVDFQHGLRFLTDSLVLNSDLKFEDDHTISGYCHTKNWVERSYFFVIRFDLPIEGTEKLARRRFDNAPRYNLSFHLGTKKILLVKVALSTVSVEGARLNLKTDIPGWNFDEVKEHAYKTWNDLLGKIDIETDSKQKEVFYTSLYHFMLQPSNIADVDGEYRGGDDKIGMAPGKEYYSTLYIWDIYRGAFPLLEILFPEKINGIVNTLLLHQKATGFLPIWTAWGKDNYCMIGNHAIPMILSATNKGFSGFDKKLALRAMVETSTVSHINSDWDLYNKYGYYPFDKLENEAVSRTLESGYDDWCVAQMALLTGNQPIAQRFQRRANYYKNLYDTATKLFHGKDSKGNWRTPFDPLQATSPMNNPGDYT